MKDERSPLLLTIGEYLEHACIYACLGYMATLWLPWGSTGSEFLGKTTQIRSGLEFTDGRALRAASIVLCLTLAQYAARPTIESFTWRAQLPTRLAMRLVQSLVYVSQLIAAVYLVRVTYHGDLLNIFGVFENPLGGWILSIVLAWTILFLSIVAGLLIVLYRRRARPQSSSPSPSLEKRRLESSDRVSSTPKHVVLLVHGTGSSSDENSGHQWWQAGSAFSQRLNKLLNPGTACHTESEVFHWSGRNSERDRRAAGVALLRCMLALERSQAPYSLVTHSHGGSVLWHALRLAARRKHRLPQLRSWTTLGTPFLGYQASLRSLWLFLPLAAIGRIALDYQSLKSIVFETGPLLITHAYYSTLLVLATLAIILLITTLYTSVRVLRTLWAWGQCRLDLVLNRRALDLFGDRWLPLWSSSDEAILGLQATLNVRRMGDKKTMDPTAAATRLLSPLLRPLRLIRNELLEPLLDELVWRRVLRATQGSDRPDIDLAWVSASPVQEKRVASLSNGENTEIVSGANEHARQAVELMRLSLGAAATSNYAPVRVREHLSELLNGRELVHWSYYQNERLLKRIASHIDQPRGPEIQETQVAIVRSHDGRRARPDVLALLQLLLIAVAAIVWSAVDRNILDQFKTERQLKEIAWHVPTLPDGLKGTHEADTLLRWARAYVQTGLAAELAPGDGTQARTTGLPDKVQLALVWALVEEGGHEASLLDARFSIGDPFLAMTEELLTGKPDPGRSSGVRKCVREMAEVDADTRAAFVRSALLATVTEGSAFEPSPDGRELALLHAQLWLGGRTWSPDPPTLPEFERLSLNPGSIAELLTSHVSADHPDSQTQLIQASQRALAAGTVQDARMLGAVLARSGHWGALGELPDDNPSGKALDQGILDVIAAPSGDPGQTYPQIGKKDRTRRILGLADALRKGDLAVLGGTAESFEDAYEEVWQKSSSLRMVDFVLRASEVLRKAGNTKLALKQVVDAVPNITVSQVLDVKEFGGSQRGATTDEVLGIASELALNGQLYLARRAAAFAGGSMQRLAVDVEILTSVGAKQRKPTLAKLYHIKHQELGGKRQFESNWLNGFNLNLRF